MILEKMSILPGEPVQYSLGESEQKISLNPLLGRAIEIVFSGVRQCIVCSRKIKKTFAEGLCYPCFESSPENSPCIVRPELCEGHNGGGRDQEWEQRNHVQPHVVYLSETSTVKVGVTRETQIPTRWLDQGAIAAIVLARTPYRRLAGEIEVLLKGFVSDKTAWQGMLKQRSPEADLRRLRLELQDKLPYSLQEFICTDPEEFTYHYPVLEYPTKVVSLSLDKEPRITGQLVGIKGQYLIFAGGRVVNIRKHSGYDIELSSS
jgi:hypothetical protein